MPESANETELSIPEGVLLAHALVARTAESLGIRAFFIKGPISVIQGLREPRTSSDVDVFVAPSSLDQLLQALRDRGWRQRPVDPDSKTFPKHSLALDHPDWPCCLDVHFRFPGMENPASDCFEVMWAHAGRLELAGQQLRVPTEALGILILALHALRTPHLPASRQELDFLARLAERESKAPAMLELAIATGSLAAIRPFLEAILPATIAVSWPQPSIEWRNRLMAREPGSARLIAIIQAPWRDKSKMFWRAAFPQREVFLTGNIYADMSLKGRLRQHLRRWTRFLRSFPRLLQDLHRFRG